MQVDPLPLIKVRQSLVLMQCMQVEKLLQKFMSSNVIEEVRGKLREFKEDSCYLYRFVTQPGPFNFVGDENSTPHSTPNRRAAGTTPSSLGKRRREKEASLEYDGTWFANDYASTSADEQDAVGESSDMVLGTPVQKRSRKSHGGRSGLPSSGRKSGSRRVSAGGRSRVTAAMGGSGKGEIPPRALVAEVWKELTLNRYLV